VSSPRAGTLLADCSGCGFGVEVGPGGDVALFVAVVEEHAGYHRAAAASPFGPVVAELVETAP
jgi:hypothetical protein